jgi:hypothetical protein
MGRFHIRPAGALHKAILDLGELIDPSGSVEEAIRVSFGRAAAALPGRLRVA